MTEPKKFVINEDISIDQLLHSGFINYDRFYVYKKCLYYYDKTKNPYITFTMDITFDNNNKPMMIYDIICDDGYSYPAFYDPEIRHDNTVYEKTVIEFNKIIDKLVANKILKIGE